ncbi:hypothetical protein BDQ17DRAFT_1335498 [Cyathus striatus]|nr:hypothetical protein BDQ17DRAFT_1335498 [Cyathus striatus]
MSKKKSIAPVVTSPANSENEMLHNVLECVGRVEVTHWGRTEMEVAGQVAGAEGGGDYKLKIAELETRAEGQSNFNKESQHHKDVLDGSIACPTGTAGQHFSIQVVMGLAGSAKKDSVYKGIMVHEKQPFLKRFRNDWAMEEIIKQYFKNRHTHGYQQDGLKLLRNMRT